MKWHWGLPLALVLVAPSLAVAARQQIYVTGTVQSFGTYTASSSLTFDIREPGTQELGVITVEGLYNGEYPWILRLYTENTQYAGVAGMLRRPSPAGLVSKNGQALIPLEAHSPAFGPDVWRRIPDVLEDPYVPYRPSDNPNAPEDYSDCIILGIDPRHAPWVSGADHQLFTPDDNVLGDMTVSTPFAITVRARVEAAAVQGSYDTVLYLELVPAP